MGFLVKHPVGRTIQGFTPSTEMAEWDDFSAADFHNLDS